MKTKTFTIASRLAFLPLFITIALIYTSCGSDDAEPSIDELLSSETTPVSFELFNGTSYLFDYTGSHYVGSDTVYASNGKFYKDGRSFINNVDVELRRGTHHLIWIHGIGEDLEHGTFNPATKVIRYQKTKRDSWDYDPTLWYNIQYAECDVKVSEYLLPTQKLQFNPVTAKLRVEVEGKGDEIYSALGFQNYKHIGTITGIPIIESVEMTGEGYTQSTEQGTAPVLLRRGIPDNDFTTDTYILCPMNGLQNIQLTAEVVNVGIVTNPTTIVQIQNVEFRRGYTTVLRGFLSDNTVKNWYVSMKPYYE